MNSKANLCFIIQISTSKKISWKDNYRINWKCPFIINLFLFLVINHTFKLVFRFLEFLALAIILFHFKRNIQYKDYTIDENQQNLKIFIALEIIYVILYNCCRKWNLGKWKLKFIGIISILVEDALIVFLLINLYLEYFYIFNRLL